jgi:hypothetical protein
MSPSHADKRGVRYRYYVRQAALRNLKAEAASIGRVAAPDIERLLPCIGRMLRRPPSHHVDQVHPRLERAHHASCGLLKHPIGNVIEEMTLELEINNEVDASLVPKRRKCPCVC